MESRITGEKSIKVFTVGDYMQGLKKRLLFEQRIFEDFLEAGANEKAYKIWKYSLVFENILRILEEFDEDLPWFIIGSKTVLDVVVEGQFGTELQALAKEVEISNKKRFHTLSMKDWHR